MQTVVLARGLTGAQTYTAFQHDLVLFALVAAGLALLASTFYATTTRNEVSKKYRGAANASMLISAVATVSYLVLTVAWLKGFRLQDERWVPNPDFYFSDSLRYPDWTVTVPLLCVELLAVCSMAGAAARRLRATVMPAAFLMIVTGFLGQAVDEGKDSDTTALLVWGAVSTVFYVYLYVVLGRAVQTSVKEIGPAAATSLRNAAILLFSVWGVYPVVYLVFAFTHTSTTAAIAVELAFCAADVAAKAGFGALIHKVAKLRTADDALAGEDTLPDVYPEEVYVSNEKLSEPALARRTAPVVD